MRFSGALLTSAFLLSAASAEARPFRVDDIPNGSKNTCLNCHNDLKASSQTDFGLDAQTTLMGSGPVSGKHVTWAPICHLDSDGDGWPNGTELGDPDCTWKAGDPAPSGMKVFNPGDPDSHPPPVCGNGKLDAGEACEGDMMGETDCASLAAGTGTLRCTDDCKFDYSQCSSPPSGYGSGSSSGDEGSLPSAEEGGCAAGRGAPGDGLAALGIAVGLAAARAARRSRPRRRAPRANAT